MLDKSISGPESSRRRERGGTAVQPATRRAPGVDNNRQASEMPVGACHFTSSLPTC